MRKKPGRPRLKNPKRFGVSTALTQGEFEALSSLAEQDDVSICALIRALIVPQIMPAYEDNTKSESIKNPAG